MEGRHANAKKGKRPIPLPSLLSLLLAALIAFDYSPNGTLEIEGFWVECEDQKLGGRGKEVVDLLSRHFFCPTQSPLMRCAWKKLLPLGERLIGRGICPAAQKITTLPPPSHIGQSLACAALHHLFWVGMGQLIFCPPKIGKAQAPLPLPSQMLKSKCAVAFQGD
jgi:hypothetical protein